MSLRPTFLIALVFYCSINTCVAQQSKVTSDQSPAYVLTIVETQLQKRMLNLDPGDNLTAWYLELNGNRFFDANADAVQQWEAVENALGKIRNAKNGVFACIGFYGNNFDPDAMSSVQTKLGALFKDGPQRLGGRVTAESDPLVWPNRIKLMELENGDGEEIVVGDEDFTLYSAVRPFSKFLTQGSTSYVEIHSKVKQRDGFLNPKIRKELTRALEKNDLKSSGKISFTFGAIEAEGAWMQEMQTELKKFAKSLDIEKVSLTVMPQMVDRTESLALIGSPAPDFELRLLDSDSSILFSKLRDRKFTILNFWGFT